MKAQLCICNKCGTIMFDQNPDDQPEFETENIVVVDMEEFEDSGGFYYCCPVCLVDDNLMDVTDISQLKTP